MIRKKSYKKENFKNENFFSNMYYFFIDSIFNFISSNWRKWL
nr:MAG TPA: hypothetical protein [Caudoviricetes sp.]